MKKTIVLIFFTLIIGNCYSQSEKVGLSDKVQLTYKDYLNLKLQILAAQMSSGSYIIIDIGRIDYPVSITINEQSKILFEIEKRLDTELAPETQKDIMEEGFVFVMTAISELIRRDFKNLNFDYQNDIIGYWYYNRIVSPKAKWEKGKFVWL